MSDNVQSRGASVEPASAARSLDWFMVKFVGDVPGVSHAILVSADGLLMASGSRSPTDDTDQMAALTSGLASLANGAARLFRAGAVRQSIIEMEDAFLLVMGVGNGSYLAVLTSVSCDIGQVGYEMAVLVDRVGKTISGGAPRDAVGAMTVIVNPPEHRQPASRARPYALTGGRTRPQIELPLEATVEAVASDAATGALDDVSSTIIRLCEVRQSIAEISSLANMPIGVTRVLVADLVESGHLQVHATLTDRSTLPERRGLIERTLDGLRTL